MDTLVDFVFWLLWAVLLQTWWCRYLRYNVFTSLGFMPSARIAGSYGKPTSRFKEISILLSTMVVLICIPTRSVTVPPFLLPYQHLSFFIFWTVANLAGLWWYLIVCMCVKIHLFCLKVQVTEDMVEIETACTQYLLYLLAYAPNGSSSQSWARNQEFHLGLPCLNTWVIFLLSQVRKWESELEKEHPGLRLCPYGILTLQIVV